MSPGLRPPASRRWTSPSISGASPSSGGGAAGFAVHGVEQDVDVAADLLGQLLGADARGEGHDAVVAVLLGIVRDLVGEVVGGGALNRLRT